MAAVLEKSRNKRMPVELLFIVYLLVQPAPPVMSVVMLLTITIIV